MGWGIAPNRTLADGETPHDRAFWLATRPGRPEPLALGWLQAALWEKMPGRREGPDHADNRVRRTRDASEFVARVPYLPARAADPMRQMGDFAGAGPMRCDALSLVGQPGFGDGWRTYLNPSAIVIARRGASVAPPDMIPAQEAAP